MSDVNQAARPSRGACAGRRPRLGAAAVELALVLPLLLMLVLGALDWGYYFWVRQVVVHAAHEGARAGSLEPSDDAAALGEAAAATTTYVAVGGLDPERATVTTTLVGDTVRVAVTYPAGSLTGFASVVVPESVVVTAEMRRR